MSVYFYASLLITKTRLKGTGGQCDDVTCCFKAWVTEKDSMSFMLIISFPRGIDGACAVCVIPCLSFCVYYFSSVSLVWVAMSPVLQFKLIYILRWKKLLSVWSFLGSSHINHNYLNTAIWYFTERPLILCPTGFAHTLWRKGYDIYSGTFWFLLVLVFSGFS